MTYRSRTWRVALLAVAAGFLVSCGYDTVAGKTTTTTNGGGTIVAVGPDGSPLSGAVAYAARSWDTLAGTPGIVDTLHGDSTGAIALARDAYAFLEIRDSSLNLGAWVKLVVVRDGNTRTIRLDTLRCLKGRWADRASVAQGRLFLDSTFRSESLPDDGSFEFDKVPAGDYALELDPDSGSLRPMGDARLGDGDVRYVGSGNILLEGDTTGSPLWIDNFESGGIWPMIRSSYPSVSPWFVWSVQADLILPGSVEPASILRAIGPDSSRPGRVFHTRFTPTGSNAQVAAGITNLEIDLRARGEVCFSYRADGPVQVEFQRDSISGVRPSLSATLPPASQWNDTCASTSDFVPGTDTPDSLATWNAFARRVLVIQFSTYGAATFLDLDDIRLR